ncbi:MAG: M14 family zinc carboxypeptidase [Candidatus Thorarchaeota archaeon]
MTQTFLLTLLLSSFLPSIAGLSTTADAQLSVIIVDTPSVQRSWTDVSLIYQNQWHDPAQVDEEIANIASLVPELVDLEVIGQSHQGRNISVLRITNEQNTVMKAKTLVVAHHHGREQITIEMALRFVLRLVNLYGVDSTITDYIDSEEIYVIPTLNPDALERVVNEDDHWLRKNLRPYDDDMDGQTDEDTWEDVDGDGQIAGYDVYIKDGDSLEYQYTYYEGIDNDGDGLVNEDPIGLVDINRNYQTGWGTDAASSPDPLSQVYRGPSYFSEAETQVFRDFALQHRFAIAHSVHSGTNATLFPSDDSGFWEEPTIFYQVVQDFNEMMSEGFNNVPGYPGVDVGRTDTRNLAASSGYWDDWMYHERGTVVPITFELYHNASVDAPEEITIIEDNSTHRIEEWNGIYGYFNPIESRIDDVWDDVMPGFDYLLEMTPRLEANAASITGVGVPGSTINLAISLRCLSTLLGSIDGLDLIGPDGMILTSWSAIDPDTTQTLTGSYEYPAGLSDSQYHVRIGNNFTGYVQLQISLGPGGTFDFLPIIAVAGVAVVAVVIIVIWKRSS